MLSKEDNERVTWVGPGTEMGTLMRRYWTPALLSEELPSAGGDPVRVRLLGEDLVAFRDLNGRIGLIQENCPHRGASLWFGRNEGSSAAPTTAAEGVCGLRCPYHGWQFDGDGRCIDMPSEPASSSFKERVQAKAYPVHESGGIIWAYLGPRESLTPFRDFGTDSLATEHVMAGKTFSPLAASAALSMTGSLIYAALIAPAICSGRPALTAARKRAPAGSDLPALIWRQ